MSNNNTGAHIVPYIKTLFKVENLQSNDVRYFILCCGIKQRINWDEYIDHLNNTCDTRDLNCINQVTSKRTNKAGNVLKTTKTVINFNIRTNNGRPCE